MRFTDKVLSHLTDNKQLKFVKAELDDHIDMNCRFYEEIGYDKDTAMEKADEKMGDADVVGEQLKAINLHKARKNIFYVLFAVVLLVLLALYLCLYCIDYDYGYSYSVNDIDSFIVYIWYNVLIIFSLLNILILVKKCKLLSGMIGYIVFCFVYCRNIFSCFLSNSIANIFYGYSNAKEFYFRDDLDYSFFVSLDRPLQYILYYGIIILVTSIFLFGVYNIIKTKLMKNTKLDFRIKQIVSVVCATFLIAVSVLFVGICAHTLSIRNDVRNDVDKDMTYYSNLLIENMDDLTINDMNSFIDFYDNYFYTPYEVEDVDFNLLKYSDSEIKRKYRNVVSYSYMDLDSFKISFYSNASDVLSNSSMDADKETVAKAVRFAQENVKTSNIDFPIGQRVDFYFDRNTGETTLEIAYYGCGEIVYKSNDNGELIFVSYEFFED